MSLLDDPLHPLDPLFSMTSDCQDGCRVVIEYPPVLDIAGVSRTTNSARKTETFDNADVFVDEDNRTLRVTGGKNGARSISFSLNKFMFFNGHAGKGKIGLKFLASRYNEKQVTVLVSSPDLALISDINQGILNLNKENRRGRPDISKTPLESSPNKFRSPDLKKSRAPSDVPVRRFGFGVRTSPIPIKMLNMGKSPQVVFEEEESVIPPPRRAFVDTSDLSTEQRRVFETVLRGDSVFFTGSGGCGKSYLLKKIISALPPDTTAVTASTGIAACHIGGVTLHHFLGIGRIDPGVAGAAQVAVNKIKKNFEKSSILRKTKTIIIDEISLVDKNLFELMHELLTGIRVTPSPFGGVQLVLCGDFLQLPPVGDSKSVKFCFQSKLWRKCLKHTFYLEKIFRQQDDQQFVDLLNEIRFGTCSESSARLLVSRKINSGSSSSSIQLCPVNREVDEINQRALADRRDNPSVPFEAIDTIYDPSFRIDPVCLAKRSISLVVGARVILLATVSFSEKLVNGSTGTVVRITQTPPVVYVRFDNNSDTPVGVSYHDFAFRQSGKEIARRRQIPLALAWAISIHKSQGMTLEKCVVSVDKIFENGQAYVALSRCKSLEGLALVSNRAGGLTAQGIMNAIKANPVCVEFYNKLKEVK
jgi:energy-coupling factor transporter ATP-binding protein EcfA2